MKILMDLGLSALFLHCMHALYIQMSQSRYVKFENRGMLKFSQLLRPNVHVGTHNTETFLDTHQISFSCHINQKHIISSSHLQHVE